MCSAAAAPPYEFFPAVDFGQVSAGSPVRFAVGGQRNVTVTADDAFWRRWYIPMGFRSELRLPGGVKDWRNDLASWPPNTSVASKMMRNGEQTWFMPVIRPRGLAGCYASHLGVLLEAKRRGLRHFLVLEDDAVLKMPNFAEKLYAAVAQLPESWDLLNIGWTKCVACELLTQDTHAHTEVTAAELDVGRCRYHWPCTGTSNA